MTPTQELIQQAGLVTLLGVLVLALGVVVLRLLALPLAVTVLVLDNAADLAGRYLSGALRTPEGEPYVGS